MKIYTFTHKKYNMPWATGNHGTINCNTLLYHYLFDFKFYLLRCSKDARLPEQLQRAMAAEAEASREARAKVIAADGEMRASKALREASVIIEQSPAALQLRYLQVVLNCHNLGIFQMKFYQLKEWYDFIWNVSLTISSFIQQNWNLL